jgi:hypothetical protein
MSWGERSCKNKPCPIPNKRDIDTCNVDCPSYEWDGITAPDSVSHKNTEEKAEEKTKAGELAKNFKIIKKQFVRDVSRCVRCSAIFGLQAQRRVIKHSGQKIGVCQKCYEEITGRK